MPTSPPDEMLAELERRLIRAVGNPGEHAKVRQEIREAGFPALADELDRISAQWHAEDAAPTACGRREY